MDFQAEAMIRKRKSVRTYDGKGLAEEDLQKLNDYIREVKNPFGVPVCMKILEAAKHGITSPVVTGEKYYLAGKVRRVENCDAAFGYSFEKACLYALSLGLGTVIIAGTMNRQAVERAMDVAEDEVLPAASPIGRPAEKRSVRETIMRRAIRADDRLPFGELFFDGSFGMPLTEEKAGIYARALQMVRLSPSAVNRQPWRAVVAGDRIDFYEEQTMKETALGDVQKVDLGIALCHFDLSLEEDGIRGTFFAAEDVKAHDGNRHYILSWRKAEE